MLRLFRTLPTRSFDPVSASLLFQAAFLVSAALGIIRQVLFNATFGTGPEASAYIAAFRLPETLLNLVGGGALSSAMIPVLLRTVREDGIEAERELVRVVLALIGVVTLGASLLGMVFAGPFVRWVLAPGFPPETRDLTTTLARLMLVQPPFIIVTTMAIAVLGSRNQFFLSALSVALHNVALIGGIGASMAFPQLGVYGPVGGLLADGVLQAAILLPGLRANHFQLLPRATVATARVMRRVREVVTLMVPSGLSAIVNYSGTIIDTAAASFAREAGALPAINSAFLLIGLPTRLLGQAVSSAVFPRFAAHAAGNDAAAFRRLLGQAIVVACGLAIPAALALVAIGRWIVQILFERGAFTAQAGDLTYAVLVAYAAGLPFYVATDIISRGLAALYDTRTPLLTNLLQVAGRVACIGLLLSSLGAVAIPIAFAVTSALEACVLGTVLWWRLGTKRGEPVQTNADL